MVQIVTFGTLAAAVLVRDVGRVLDMPYAQVDSIAKMVPAKIPNVKLVTIDKAMEVNPELKKAYDEQPDVHHLIDMAKRLEGLPRHTSMHAAGGCDRQPLRSTSLCLFPGQQTELLPPSLP